MRGAMANGKNLKAARTIRGLTQEQLAALAGVDAKTVRNAEQSKRLDVGSLARLALALGTELHRVIRSPNPLAAMLAARRKAVEKWQAAWKARDMNALLALYHEQAALHLPGGPIIPFGGEFRGKESVQQVAELAWAIIATIRPTFQDHSLIVSGAIAVLYGACGLRRPDGAEIRLSSTHLFTFDKRLIIDHRVDYDTLSFVHAMPLPPDSPPRGLAETSR
jgi:transcriptional regulator with XRE-family HTH domain